MDELSDVQRALMEQREMYEAQAAEIKKLREDQVGLASRLANALQLAQVSVIEADAAKAQANSAVADGQATHSALTQATHKIQAAEAECAKLRSVPSISHVLYFSIVWHFFSPSHSSTLNPTGPSACFFARSLTHI
jgi:hypothetical protein